jgi:pyrroloquinoline quinone (PQQ) biosynthesis protein C
MDPVLQWVLGGCLTCVIAIVGGFVRYLFGVIKTHKEETSSMVAEIKEDTHAKIEALKVETEARRQETRDTLLQLINTKFDAIWESIRDLKDRIN